MIFYVGSRTAPRPVIPGTPRPRSETKTPSARKSDIQNVACSDPTRLRTETVRPVQTGKKLKKCHKRGLVKTPVFFQSKWLGQCWRLHGSVSRLTVRSACAQKLEGQVPPRRAAGSKLGEKRSPGDIFTSHKSLSKTRYLNDSANS